MAAADAKTRACAGPTFEQEAAAERAHAAALYGGRAGDVLAREAALNARFVAVNDRFRPPLWPVEPIKPT